jgi:hypothetical protein
VEVYDSFPFGASAVSDVDRIPRALAERPQWMGVVFEPRPDQSHKLNKPPYALTNGAPYKAAKTNSDNWVSFETACEALERGDVDAIGFCFSPDDPLWVADFDDVLDSTTGELDERAARTIHALDSYEEISVSGTGIHVVGVGKKPEWADCQSKALGFSIELYEKGRFLVTTGRVVPGAHREPQPRQRQLEDLCERVWPKSKRMYDGRPGEANANRFTDVSDLNDATLLDRARRARTGAKFRKLFDAGDRSGYTSPSEADYGLINYLIFWTGGDRGRIISLFQQSALYRGEEKHRTYLERTLDRALESYSGPFYRPQPIKRSEATKADDPLAPFLALALEPSAWTGRRAASAYKAFVGALSLAADHGITDDNGDLRIGCDVRRLADAAGMRVNTMCDTALPELVKMKLVSWRKGRGKKAGVLVLKSGGRGTRYPKVSTHSRVTTFAPPENALETLRLLVRLRAGNSKRSPLLRIGMPGLFATVALLSPSRDGLTLADLAEATDRRARDLRPYLARLKAAGIAREVRPDVYKLTDSFRDRYREHLEMSGVVYSEREQRRRHREHAAARKHYQERKEDPQAANLHGKERVQRNLHRNAKTQRERWRKEREKNSSVSATEFLLSEIEPETGYGPRVGDAIGRWRLLHGGGKRELFAAIYRGPFRIVSIGGERFIDPVQPP